MRPVAQAAVVGTHALIFFSPLAVSATAAGMLVLTRFSRESFFFISALVLTYTYRRPGTFHLGQFWRRRLLLTGVPYLAWTIIYYAFIHATVRRGFPYYDLPTHYLFSASGLHDFATLLLTGYYQLYFIVVLFEFYLIFPLLLAVLRRLRRWHGMILVVAFAWEVLYDVILRHHLSPFGIGGKLQSRLILSYPIYLLGGMMVALNYERVRAWVLHRVRTLLVLTAIAAALTIGLNSVNGTGFIAVNLASNGDVFDPLAVLYNIGAILCLFALGVYLTDQHRGAVTRRVTGSTADASYGIYLSQMLWFPMLSRIVSRSHLETHVPWVLIVIGALVIVFAVGYVVTIVFERTPLARPLTGRTMVRWWQRPGVATRVES